MVAVRIVESAGTSGQGGSDLHPGQWGTGDYLPAAVPRRTVQYLCCPVRTSGRQMINRWSALLLLALAVIVGVNIGRYL